MARGPSSKTHPGVSVAPHGPGRWRLTWRERSGGSSALVRWQVYGDAAEVEERAIQVYRSLRATGTFTKPDENGAAAPLERPAVADLRAVFAAWCAWRVDNRGAAQSTRKAILASIQGFLAHARDELGLEEGAPVPASAMSPALCEAVLRRTKETPSPRSKGRPLVDPEAGRRSRPKKPKPKVEPTPPGPHRVAQLLRYVYAAWEWASDEPERWPGLAPAPRTKSRVVPAVPVSSRALPAPTWEEMDLIVACARASRSPDVADVLELARGTGLRVGQVLRLEVRDVRLGPSPTLRIRGELGKSQRERQGRTVPLAPVLVPLLERLVAGRAGDARLFERGEVHPATMRRILAAAEVEGLRPDVWRSDERGNDRITHFMRAGFQRGLRRAGVEDRIIDALVGHDQKTTRDESYDPAGDDELVEAVARVPAVVVAAPRLTVVVV